LSHLPWLKLCFLPLYFWHNNPLHSVHIFHNSNIQHLDNLNDHLFDDYDSSTLVLLVCLSSLCTVVSMTRIFIWDRNIDLRILVLFLNCVEHTSPYLPWWSSLFARFPLGLLVSLFFFHCSYASRKLSRSLLVISSNFLDSSIAHTIFSKSSVNDLGIFFTPSCICICICKGFSIVFKLIGYCLHTSSVTRYILWVIHLHGL